MDFKRFALAMMGHFLASLLYILTKLRLVNAVVDTSSILEHREEIRELWERKMIADDMESSPSSVSVANTKPSVEEGDEEQVAKVVSEGETQIPNGVTKYADGNGNAVLVAEETSPQMADAEEEDGENNAPDSLEINGSEEKTYTSELHTSLVVKQEQTELKASETVQEEAVKEEIEMPVEKVATEDGKESSEGSNGIAEVSAEEYAPDSEKNSDEPPTADPILVTPAPEGVAAESEQKLAKDESEIPQREEEKAETNEEIAAESVPVEDKVDAKPFKEKELEINIRETDDDGFVSVEECLPKTEEEEEVFQEKPKTDDAKQVTSTCEPKAPISNGHTSPAVSITPEADSKPINEPEMEAFVKSGGVKRILPGVQKTEQPYSSCTTETKIAMEIREMREREEELRLMRERALTSPPPPAKTPSPLPPKEMSVPSSPSPTPSAGYKVSSVFGRGSPVEPAKGFVKESAVEREIRLARDREEELRKQKGLPPREDDSYVKPSQVKSSQVRVFGKTGSHVSMKQAATAKIQLEIEEQTQREMALRETGSIQTISQERTDAKVAKLKAPEDIHTNGNTNHYTNGNAANGRVSPDVAPYKRGSPSPTGPRPANIFSQSNGKSAISMHKFIASKGKEATFARNGNGVTSPKEEVPAHRVNVPPTLIKLKRNVSVESKIQQEIMEMKQREEELKLLHFNQNGNSEEEDNEIDHDMNHKNNCMDYDNGNGYTDEEMNPRHNKLIAQWEQRIQKAES